MAVRRLIATLLLLPVLAACSDDEPGSSDTGDPTTPATSDPTPTETPPPTEPPEAGEKTEAGAKAFVKYWIETLNYSGKTGDTEELRRIGSSSCRSCASILDLIDGVYADGGKIIGEGWEPKRLRMSTSGVGDRIEVRAVVRINPQVIRHGDGSPADRFPGNAKAIARFELKWSATRWTVAEMFQGRTT